MYITKNFVTSTRMIPGQSYELTPELEQKFRQYRAFSKLVFDDAGNLVDIVEDTEKKAAWEAEEAANQPDPLEENLKAVRRQRARYLKAFDIYKSNVSYGVETETEEQKAEVLAWYSALLDITELVTAESVPDFPQTPACVARYM